jgi:guanylate kinase
MDDLLLLIISSPSGAGKTTLTRKLLESFMDLTFSVSHTTRPPRTGEVEGQDYYFVDRSTFERTVHEGRFAEWAEVHGNLYGTSLSELDRARELGKKAIVFDVDYQGARQIKARLPQAVGVFILPPSMDELRKRLEGRALDSAEVIERRFDKARLEIEHYLFFDYLVVNDKVEEAAARLRGIVYAERSRRERLAGYAENLLRSGIV